MTPSENQNAKPVAIVTGGSAGLGLVIAKHFLADGYRVVIVGRDQARLDSAAESLERDTNMTGGQVLAISVDVANQDDAGRIAAETAATFGRVDVLVNCVGTSDRGLVEDLESDRLSMLFTQNVTSMLLCSQAVLPDLRRSSGTIVNIGSLASKVGAPYIGGYAAVKHALVGLTQQMRLELREDGVHVGIVCPGPIRRQDAGARYQAEVNEKLPADAAKPGGGAKVKGLDPDVVAAAVIKCVRKRLPEMILPRHMRLLIAVGNAFPGLGDWLLLKFTSGK